MSHFEQSVTLSVYPDPDYHYEVSAGFELYLQYVEEGRDDNIRTGFGSIEEMEAVAKAMLKVVALVKESKNEN